MGGPRGELDWAFKTMDGEVAEWMVETLWMAGLHLMGSRTFQDMKAHWPLSTEPYAPPMNEVPKVVFSRKGIEPSKMKAAAAPKSASWTGARVVRGDLAEEISRLKAEPGKDLLAHGGASFAQSLARLGLVDEYRLVVHPVALGRGLPLFSELPEPLHLELAGTTRFKSGVVAQVYRRGSTG